MAQPRRKPESASNILMALRLTAEERDAIEAAAAAAGMPASTWVRGTALAVIEETHHKSTAGAAS